MADFVDEIERFLASFSPEEVAVSRYAFQPATRRRAALPAVNWREIAEKLLPATALRLMRRAGSTRALRRRRRNLAVMFVDIQGCTRLCERLPPRQMERVHAVYFARYMDAVREAGGSVTEVLGDGLVALFEGPSLRKDSLAALRAAVQIQATTRALNRRNRGRHEPIRVNVGLNAGAEVIGITALRARSGERWFYRAVGPVTNIAARLSELAERGQTLVSGEVARWTAGAYALRALGPRRLKNVSGAVRVFEVRAPGVDGESRRRTARRRRANG